MPAAASSRWVWRLDRSTTNAPSSRSWRALRGCRFVGDKGFDADCFAARLRGFRIRVCIPARKQRRRPLPFHRGYYRLRHHVENGFARLKRFRRVGTRYEKLALTFLGFVQPAAIFDWLAHGV